MNKNVNRDKVDGVDDNDDEIDAETSTQNATMLVNMHDQSDKGAYLDQSLLSKLLTKKEPVLTKPRLDYETKANAPLDSQSIVVMNAYTQEGNTCEGGESNDYPSSSLLINQSSSISYMANNRDTNTAAEKSTSYRNASYSGRPKQLDS